MPEDLEPADHAGNFWGVLADALREIGSANDAEDRGYTREAAQMREQSTVLIKSLLTHHPEIGIRFPALAGEVYSLPDRWLHYYEQLRRS